MDSEWTYLPPSAFDHSTTSQLLPNGWNNLKCSYRWLASGDGGSTHGGDGGSGNGNASFSFRSPIGCLGDDWAATPAVGVLGSTASAGRDGPPLQTVTLTFRPTADPTTATEPAGREVASPRSGTPRGVRQRHGIVSEDCAFIDEDGGGLWSRGPHPIDQSHHDWLRTTTAWLS